MQLPILDLLSFREPIDLSKQIIIIKNILGTYIVVMRVSLIFTSYNIVYSELGVSTTLKGSRVVIAGIRYADFSVRFVYKLIYSLQFLGTCRDGSF